MPSATTPALKRQNHRIHPCTGARKNDLLNHLIGQYAGKSILIVAAGDLAQLNTPENADVILTTDLLLAQSPELKCDVVISYNLPDKAIIYMSRFARAREYALILLGAEDQKLLYPIETLLGRTITQEAISGFEPDFGIAVEQKSKEEAKARREEREVKAQSSSKDRLKAPGRDNKMRPSDKNDRRPDFKRDERGGKEETRPVKKPFSEDKKQGGFGKKSAKPRFIGKDENGKPIFEGKTRERNHYHDGTPRSDAEKAARTPYSSKPKFFGNDKKDSDKPREDKKPYEKKPFDKDKKPYEGKKPYDKSAKPSSNRPKPVQSEPAAPKRPPRRINVKSLKPPKESE